jgi:EAL domain-containing protein (putative c-di-GMP-specific phosphodiesterase class I)
MMTVADPRVAGEGLLPRSGTALGFSITMAFQPIIDIESHEVYSYEALVRGTRGESAALVLSNVTNDRRYVFDQICRMKALSLGKRLRIATRRNINFMPNALYELDTCLRTTVRAAHHYGFPIEQIVFEVMEGERVMDIKHVAEVIQECQKQGLRIAIDDFGAGYSGLNLLADLHPDMIKLDIGLCRAIDTSPVRQAIVHGVMVACDDLHVEVIAEGVEKLSEFVTLRTLGVRYFQGYLFARPSLESLPDVTWPTAH